VQAAAREARYGLMCGQLLSEATGRQARTLVTAHHADDQAETVLMRLARGSGVDGLAAMRPTTLINGVSVVRPLLTVTKARLLATLKAGQHIWCDDPSNADDRFERVRWRAETRNLAALGVTSEALSETARRLARAQSALEASADALSLHCNENHHGGAYTALDFEPFIGAHNELRIRVLRRLIGFNGGGSPAAQLSEVESLSSRIETTASGAATLGGALVRWSRENNALTVGRELSRIAPPIRLMPGQCLLWDQRFRVGIIDDHASHALCQSGPLTVRALGVADYATVRKQLRQELPSEVAATLPAFIFGQDQLLVPYFSDQSTDLAGPVGASGHRLCFATAVTTEA
jgi:tRNA(Ile)-lysidine synthase